MNLKEIYLNAVAISDKIVSEDKKDLVFIQSCNFFFSRINPILKIEDLENPPPYLEITRELDNSEYQTIATDFDNYILPIEYRAVFTEISIYFLNEVEKDNIQFMSQMGADLQGDYIDGSLLDLEEKCSKYYLIEPSCIVIG